MTLKRKLRRIRSNVQNNLKEANVTMPTGGASTFSLDSPDALDDSQYEDDDDDELIKS